MARELMMGGVLTGELKMILDSYNNSYIYVQAVSTDKNKSTDNTDNTDKNKSTDNGDQSNIGKILVRQDRLNEKQFTENVMMALIKTLRNLGLARDAYVDWVRYKSKKIEDEKTTLSEASSFTDISADGLLPKILSFGGGGSAVTAIASFLPSNGADTEETFSKIGQMTNNIQTLNSVAENNVDVQNAAAAVAKNIQTLTDTAVKAPQTFFGLSLEQLIPIFIVAGVGILVGVTFILKIWKNRRIRVIEDVFEKELLEHWRIKTRPSMADCLFDLYKDLRFTMSLFYPDYTEMDFITTHDPVQASKTDDKTARRIIEEEIIQPESVEPSNIPFLDNKEDKGEGDDYKRRQERAEEWEKQWQKQKEASDTERRIKAYEEGEVKTGQGGGGQGVEGEGE